MWIRLGKQQVMTEKESTLKPGGNPKVTPCISQFFFNCFKIIVTIRPMDGIPRFLPYSQVSLILTFFPTGTEGKWS